MDFSTDINHLSAHSLDDDDNLSNNSRYSSYDLYNSTFNSDSECSGPVSVRDMIKLYNNNQLEKDEENAAAINHKIKPNYSGRQQQQSSQHLLAAIKSSSYCGINNYNSQTNVKQFVDQMTDKSLIADHKVTGCKNCTDCVCCQNRNHKSDVATTNAATKLSTSSLSSSLLQNNENNNCNQIKAKDILVVKNIKPKIAINKSTTAMNGGGGAAAIDGSAEFKDDLNKNHSSQVVMEKNHNHPQLYYNRRRHHHLLSTDSVEEANICQPLKTSYPSNTTIAKTSSGVRIIIDIFFDQEQCVNATDAVGSRVETDISHSRILTEFQQQQAAIANGTTTNVAAAKVAGVADVASLNQDSQQP